MYDKILKTVKMNDIKSYAQALLKTEKECWECDPSLIDEYWENEVHKFLEFLAQDQEVRKGKI